MNQQEEDDASRIACHLLRMHYLNDAERSIGAFDDKFITERYPEEWSFFMDGWKECKKYALEKMVCPNCNSKNIKHKEEYSFCEDCFRMFNGQPKKGGKQTTP